MKRTARLVGPAVLAVCLFRLDAAWAVDCPALTAEESAALIEEHLFGGSPSGDEVLVRRGYVADYDAARRVLRWAAWHAAPDYLDTPKRERGWDDFHPDPDVANPVKDGDYDGLFSTFGYARGHIVPYFISGGDRDGDGQDAEIETVESLPVEDLDDACTVFEINYMSNVAPQLHREFNGAGGLWFKLETRVREDIVGGGTPLHIIAGTVFGEAEVHKVGPDEDINVPHMFYKILIADSEVVPFLFVHKAKIGPKGCPLDAALETCIVTVADIEVITGLDFFAGLSDEDEALLEGTDGSAVWQTLLSE